MRSILRVIPDRFCQHDVLPVTVSVSSVSSRPYRDFLDLAPLFHQDAPALGIALAGLTKRDKAVEKKMPKVLAQLAPRCKNARVLKDRERDRPYRAAGMLAFYVGIVEHDHLLGADRGPDRSKIVARVGVTAWDGDEADAFDIVAQIIGENRRDLRQSVHGRMLERSIS